MKQIWKPLLNLVLVAAISVGLLFGMNALTGSLIEQQAVEGVKQAFAGVLDADRFEAIPAAEGRDGIAAAYRALDRDGKLIGFAVTATTKGYGGDMQVHTALSPDGKRFLGLRVGDNRETEGYGSRVTEEAFWRQFDSLTAPASVGGYTGMGDAPTSGGADKGLTDGTYKAAQSGYDNNGYRNFVELTIKDGKVTAVNWDADKKDGSTTKKQESRDGQYIMTENGPRWHEQAKTMEDALVAAQDPLKLTYNEADGKTDAYAGVSISVSEFVSLAAQALDQAKPSASLRDGTYKAAQSGYDNNGYQNFVELTIKDGKITAANWDADKKDGSTTKKQESRDGRYIMTENGPRWHEQAKTMEDALVAAQDPLKLTYNEADGKTDAYAGVSISVSEFVSLAAQALDQAKGGSGGVVDTGTGNGQIDAVSGATISSKAVVRAANAAYQFVQETMKENG